MTKTYLQNLVSWENYSTGVIAAITRMIGKRMILSPIPQRELRDSVYNILTKKKFDDRAFNFIWKSVKKELPGMTREEYLNKHFIRTKVRKLDPHKIGNKKRAIGGAKRINLFDNMDNEVTAQRIAKQVIQQTGVLKRRSFRLTAYRKGLTIDNINNSIKDVGRILNTFKTQEKNLNKEILRHKKRLKVAKGETLKTTKRKIKELNNQLKTVQSQNKSITNRFNKFVKNKSRMSDKKAVKTYRKILKDTNNIIVNKQQKSTIQNISKKAADKVSSIAQTERTRARATAAQFKIDKYKKSGKEYEIIIKLNPAHDIVDICDDLHGVYTVMPSEGPPPYHANCQCTIEVRLKK